VTIGVFTGSFDPPTAGHKWIVCQSIHDYDKFFVIIGKHPTKRHRHSEAERYEMLLRMMPIGLSIKACEISEFLKSIRDEFHNSDVTLIRGIRDKKDFEYEAGLSQAKYESPPIENLKQIFLIPPKYLRCVSSSAVRGEPCVRYEPCEAIENARTRFDRCLNCGIIQLPETISGGQVRLMQDVFPVDVVSSEVFFLKRIDMSDVSIIGDRYCRRSNSVGPIMVDSGYPMSIDGPLVIEGKHRFLDAKERGESDILAYVGIKAMNYFR
jgi:pantetheine-phosphate adenylyltransferase